MGLGYPFITPRIDRIFAMALSMQNKVRSEQSAVERIRRVYETKNLMAIQSRFDKAVHYE